MSSTSWYIRLGDQVLGPVSESELRDLALRGGVTARTLVSPDKLNWKEAASIRDLVFGNASSDTSQVPLPAPSPPGAQRFSPTRLFVGILLGSIGVIVCGFIVLVVIAALVGSGESDRAALPATQEQMVAQRTLAHWKGIGAATGSRGQAGNQTPQAMVAALRQSAGQIRALPTVDVDPDAVQCGNDAATVLGNLADFIEQSNNPGVVVEAFLRGAAGDPFGTAAEVLDAQSLLSQQLKQVQTELDNARAVLSSRYGIEFPAL